MPRAKKLTKRQLAVLNDLFGGDIKLDERAVLGNHHVPRSVYERWLMDQRFADELQRRITGACRQSRITLASQAPKAANKLAELANSSAGETTRKACLDIIALNRPSSRKAQPEAQPPSKDPVSTPELSPESASRILAAAAKEAQTEQ